MTVVVDLGLGNLHSVLRWCERASVSARVTDNPNIIARAGRIIVPGQGAFARCGQRLDSGLRSVLLERLEAGVPYLGICLGMQMLFEDSQEAPGVLGLGYLKGTVQRIPASSNYKVPHMGWNQVASSHSVVPDDAWFYFVHSFHCVPDEPSVVAAECDYEQKLCAAVARKNVIGVQFHPEKSAHAGVSLLHSFMEMS